MRAPPLLFMCIKLIVIFALFISYRKT
jgi:hypothetical protein